jgi:DNA mismatch repair protein MutS2
MDRRIADLEAGRAKILAKTKADAQEKISEAEEYVSIVRAELKGLLDEAEELVKRAEDDLRKGRKGSAGRASGGDGAASSRGDFYRRLDENRKFLSRLKTDYRGRDGEERISGRRSDRGESRGAEAVQVGDRVRLLGMDEEGEVLTAPDEKGDVQVRVGRIRMTAPATSLRPVGAKKKKTSAQGYRHGGLVRAKMDNISTTIDVHGQNLDEAERAVDKYLDDAFLAGLREVSIVHGRGEGILRNGLRRMLKQHRHVKSIRPGGPGEGGDGATIVTVK